MHLIECWFRGCYMNYRGQSKQSINFMWKRRHDVTHHKNIKRHHNKVLVSCYTFTDKRGLHDRYEFVIENVEWREVEALYRWYMDNWQYPWHSKLA